MKQISIIIPVYNVDVNLFKKCLDSIKSQTFKNFEIIIINDGSSKENTDLIEKVIDLEDSCIRYYYRKNCGASAARNFGIGIAEGCFLCFVDADDYLESTFLEEAYDFVIKNDADFVIGGLRLVDENGNVTKVETTSKIEKVLIYERDEIKNIRKYFISSNVLSFDQGYIGRGPVARIIKKELVKKCLFPENVKIGEDVIWNQKLFSCCNKIVIVPIVWYNYYVNSSSASQKYFPDIIEDSKKQLSELMYYLPEDDIDCLNEYGNRLLSQLNQIFIQYLTHKDCYLSLLHRFSIYHDLKKMFPWKEMKIKWFTRRNKMGRVTYCLFKLDILFWILIIRRYFKR